MRVLDAATSRDHVRGLVHLDTQRATAGLDLTVGEVERITGPGALDFGGSQFEPASTGRLEPELADPGDDYGWWELGPGSYLIRYNESLELPAGTIGVLHPLPRLMRAGASQPTFVVDEDVDPLEALLTVGEGGCDLKENCRVARLLLIEAS